MDRIIREAFDTPLEKRLLRARKIYQERFGRSMSKKETEVILNILDMLGFAIGKAMEMQARKNLR